MRAWVWVPTLAVLSIVLFGATLNDTRAFWFTRMTGEFWIKPETHIHTWNPPNTTP